MNRIRSHMEEVNLIAKLADLKEEHYRNTLLVTALMDLLIEKGILARGEIEARMASVDHIMSQGPAYPIS